MAGGYVHIRPNHARAGKAWRCIMLKIWLYSKMKKNNLLPCKQSIYQCNCVSLLSAQKNGILRKCSISKMHSNDKTYQS